MLYEPAPTNSASSVASLEDYLEALRRRKLLVLIGTLVVLGLALAYTRQREPIYEATAQVLVNPTPAGGNNGTLAAPNLERETSILLSDQIGSVARTAATATDPEAAIDGGVSAGYSEGSDVIVVTATSRGATRSAALASSYATAYVEDRLGGQSTYYGTVIASVDDELALIEPRITELQEQIAYWDNQAAGWQSLSDSVERGTALAQIQNERAKVSSELGINQTRKNTLLSSRADLARTQQVQAPAARVIAAAKTPTDAKGLPNWLLLAFGGIVGFLGSVVLAFLLERLDRSAQSSRDVELAVGRPVLGSVPRFSWRFRRGKWGLVMANDRPARSLQSAREAYRRLRSSVQFLTRADGARVIVVTSSQALEGKSTTAANLAVALALGDAKVALVSADLRRPSLERLFEIDNGRGVSDYLSGKSETLRTERFDGFETLAVLPSGPVPPNPGELLNSRRFDTMLDRLKREFDVIVIDTPPLNAAADALSAASRADGVILVVDGKRTETTDLLAIRNDLDRSGITLLGAVLNRDRTKRNSVFKRRSKYSYHIGGRKGADGAGQVALHSSRRVSDEIGFSTAPLEAVATDEVVTTPRTSENEASRAHRAVSVFDDSEDDTASNADLDEPVQQPAARRRRQRA